MNWWQRLRKRGQLETELDTELQFHFQAQVDENIRNGMSDVEARRRARIEFGGLDQVKEDCRDARGTRWIGDIAQDLRFAARLLAKDRWFTLVAILGLALGIGVNNTVFTMVTRGSFARCPSRIPTTSCLLARAPPATQQYLGRRATEVCRTWTTRIGTVRLAPSPGLARTTRRP